MTLDELWLEFGKDAKELQNECELEGYPSNGSVFGLRYEELCRLYHERERYCSDYVEEEDF